HLWETAAGKEVRQISYPESGVPYSNYSCDGVAFSPDGQVLAAGGKRLHLWDRATGKELYRSEEHQPGWGFVTFSPNAKTLAAFDHGSRTVFLWDIATRQELRRFGDQPALIRALAFSPDGKILAAGGADRTIWLWEAATGKEVSPIRGADGGVHALA